jgi:cupin 2 domain-containing protein
MTKNLFKDIPAELPEELVEVMVAGCGVRVERIVSTGQLSPPDLWYDQDESEWVVVLKGEAKLRFEHDENPIHLMPGDHVNIAAHKRHRVEWTAIDEPTVWLAVFYEER